jgi:UDP-glucose:(heptosyl)LPS alpha-1,3-glucosyltransferase
MRKIALIRANKTKFGGAENYLSRLSAELSQQNITHQVINSRISKIFPSWVRAIFFNLQVCLTKKNQFYFSLERITCPDIYRAGDGVHKVFLTTTQKSKLNPLHPVYLYLEKRCFQNARHIIANSQMIKNQIINTYNIDKDNISVVYNGVNLTNQANPAKIKQEFELTDEKILLYVGSGFKRKGVKELLELVAKLKTQNIKVFVIGKEKKIAYYQNLAKKLDVAEKIIWTGARSDVSDFYAVSDIFIFPTHYEPFSNVVLEAMSYNNVVFTTKQNGASEILDNEFIMQSPDEDISHNIDELLQNPVKLQHIQEENYQKVQQFSIEHNAKQTLEIITKVLKSVNTNLA